MVIAEMAIDDMNKSVDPDYSLIPLDIKKFNNWKERYSPCFNNLKPLEQCLKECSDTVFFKFKLPISVFESLQTVNRVLYEAITRQSYDSYYYGTEKWIEDELMTDEPIHFYNNQNPIFLRYKLD